MRLYRVGKPRGGWVGVDTVGEGVDVGVGFGEGVRMLRVESAEDEAGEGVGGKRDDVGGGEGEVVVVEGGEEEAKDLWRRRNAVVLGYVGGVEVEGRVDGGVSLGPDDV